MGRLFHWGSPYRSGACLPDSLAYRLQLSCSDYKKSDYFIVVDLITG